jgi:hypothetical protein
VDDEKVATRQRSLDQVAEIRDDCCERISATTLKARAGQFAYLGEQSEYLPFDDYRIEGCHLILGAFCNIKSPQGGFSTLLARGKITPSDIYHVLRGETEANTRYLRYVLANTPAAPWLTGSSLAERLETVNLRNLLVPWPDEEQRRGFLHIMDLLEQEMAQCPAQIDALLRIGDSLFLRKFPRHEAAGLPQIASHPGSFSPLDATFKSTRVPVFGARGLIGSTALAHTEGPALLLGQLGTIPVVSYRSSPVAVSAQMRFCQAEDVFRPLIYLFFASRHEGAVTSPRELRQCDIRRTPSFSWQEGVCPGDAPLADAIAFASEAAPLLAQTESLEQRQWALREYRQLLWRWLCLYADEYPLRDLSAFSRSFSQDVVQTFESSRNVPFLAAESPWALRPPLSLASPLSPTSPNSELPSTPESLLRYYEDLVAKLADQAEIPPAEDLIWEFLPLAFLRWRLGHKRFRNLTADIQGQSKEHLVSSLDAVLEDVAACNESVDFLRQLGYRDSLLDGVQLALCLESLAATDERMLNARSLANLYARYVGSPPQSFASPPLSPEVRILLEGLISRECDLIQQRIDTATIGCLYDPCAGTGELLFVAQRVASSVSIMACVTEFAQSLFLRLVCWQEGIEAKIQAVSALNLPLPSQKAQLVVSFPPLGKQPWTDVTPEATDERWVFGVPSPTHPDYAWIQQAISMMDENASVLLLLPDAALHTDAPAEVSLREKLAQSGLVKAVIALPGRLLAEKEPPLSLLLLERNKGRLLNEVLFVDAQNLGCESMTTPGRRVLPLEVVNQVLAVCRRHGCGDSWDDLDTRGFASVVPLSEIEARGNLLTPWIYLQEQGSRVDSPERQPPADLVEQYRAMRAQSLEARDELNDCLEALNSHFARLDTEKQQNP